MTQPFSRKNWKSIERARRYLPPRTWFVYSAEPCPSLPLLVHPSGRRGALLRRATPVLAPAFVPTAVLFSLSLTGCGFLKSLMGTNSVSLEGAEVQEMSVDIRKSQKTICPRENTQMGVFLKAVLKGEKAAKDYETWKGPAGSNKNDKLEFTDFAFNSDFGSFDDSGFFHPNPAMDASSDKEFAITTVYKRRPDKFTMEMKFKPDYQCVKGGGRAGTPGTSGTSGNSGRSGNSGSSGGNSSSGGQGGSGSPGSPGSDGGDGGDGPKLQAFATMVKTPFYDKVVAIKITGDVEDLILVPVDQEVTIVAAGGQGGPGGNGGSGGGGGSGGSGNPGGNGGSGARGGDGGSGGRGGKGGEIELTFDPKYPDLAKTIHLDSSGGAAGSSGPGGSGGSAGSAGSGSGQGARSGSAGSSGSQGSNGKSGAKGPDGRAAMKPGPVTQVFSSLSGGITLLEPAAAPPKDDPKAKDPKGKAKDPKVKDPVKK